MKAYYHDDASGITIYHGDSRDVLPHIGPVDLLLTDPPFGVKAELNSKTAKRAAWSINGERKKNAYSSAFVDSKEYVRSVVIPVIVTALSLAKRGIVSPGNACLTFYPPPDSFGCFWQPSCTGLQRWGRCDSQPIFYYGVFPRASRLIPATSLSFSLTEAPPRVTHPCPKPLRAWTKLLAIGAVAGDVVLDPFLGSGTTLRCAKDAGLRAVGIEIEERYCEIAAKRLSQGVLFGAEPAEGTS